MKRTALLVSAFLSALPLLHVNSALAQGLPEIVGDDAISAIPIRSEAEVEQERADLIAWVEAAENIKALEAGSPQQAIDEYRKFFASRPLYPTVAVLVAESIGRVYLERLDDAEQADTAYQWALKKYDKASNLYRLTPGRAKLLANAGKVEEATQLLQKDLKPILQIDVTDDTYTAPTIRDLIKYLTTLKQPKELITQLSQAILYNPTLLDRSTVTNEIYDSLIQSLIEEKRSDEAMGWARLRFATCVYNKEAIQLATQQLTKTWAEAGPTLTAKLPALAAKPADSTKTTAVATTNPSITSADDATTGNTANSTGMDGFVAAQKDPTLPNPLFQFPLPPVPRRWAADAVNLYPENYHHWRITVFIAAGMYGDAMQEAEKQFKADPSGPMGIIEACRVLKAADLHLKGAAALINYMKTKEGVDPSIALYKKYPVQFKSDIGKQ